MQNGQNPAPGPGPHGGPANLAGLGNGATGQMVCEILDQMRAQVAESDQKLAEMSLKFSNMDQKVNKIGQLSLRLFGHLNTPRDSDELLLAKRAAEEVCRAMSGFGRPNPCAFDLPLSPTVNSDLTSEEEDALSIPPPEPTHRGPWRIVTRTPGSVIMPYHEYGQVSYLRKKNLSIHLRRDQVADHNEGSSAEENPDGAGPSSGRGEVEMPDTTTEDLYIPTEEDVGNEEEVSGAA